MRLAPWLFLASAGDLGASHVTIRPEIGLSVDRVRFVRGILPLMKLGRVDGVGSYSHHRGPTSLPRHKPASKRALRVRYSREQKKKSHRDMGHTFPSEWNTARTGIVLTAARPGSVMTHQVARSIRIATVGLPICVNINSILRPVGDSSRLV